MDRNKNYSSPEEALKEMINKRFNTTTIGLLDLMEQKMGHLWGHGKADINLNDDEKENRKEWRKLRDSILDYGNRQRRFAMKDFNGFNVTQRQFNTKFLPKDYK